MPNPDTPSPETPTDGVPRTEAPAPLPATAAERFDPAAETGLLVVLPHPDDESFAAGGTMALCADAGARVTYLCGTYGDMGRRMGRPAFATRESLRDIRQRELQEACAVLGAEVRFLGLRDKCVEFEDPDRVAASIRAIIRELEPSTVITFYPGHGVHPDHDALGHATVLAVRGLPAEERPRLLAVAVGLPDTLLTELGVPDVACDIRATRQRKIDALKAHRSQTEAMFRQWEEGRDPDPQMKAFRERMLDTEQFYRLDPDTRTLVE